jgi:hypothetical protein
MQAAFPAMGETIRYIAETKVARVEERFVKQPRPGTQGVGDKADMVDNSIGWWIVTQAPQPYAFCTGTEKPPHEVGDTVKIILEVS